MRLLHWPMRRISRTMAWRWGLLYSASFPYRAYRKLQTCYSVYGIAARTSRCVALLSPWSYLTTHTQTNQMACMRLVERCATILISIRDEIVDAAQTSPETLVTLQPPVEKLVSTFLAIDRLMRKQVERSFLKRYIKRSDIQGQIRECNDMLTDAISVFGLSVQIRALKEVQASERNRKEMERRLLTERRKTLDNKLITSNSKEYDESFNLTADEDEDPLLDPSLPSSYASENGSMPTSSKPFAHSTPVDTIQALRSRQFALDQAADSADLQRKMRTALRSSSDVEMIQTLQVQNHELAEAVKTLQRALEDPKIVPVTSSRRGTMDEAQTQQARADSDDVDDSGIHREFVESGIDALRRLSSGKGLEEEGLPAVRQRVRIRTTNLTDALLCAVDNYTLGD